MRANPEDTSTRSDGAQAHTARPFTRDAGPPAPHPPHQLHARSPRPGCRRGSEIATRRAHATDPPGPFIPALRAPPARRTYLRQLALFFPFLASSIPIVQATTNPERLLESHSFHSPIFDYLVNVQTYKLLCTHFLF